MPRYKKGDIRYYKNIFKLNYEPVTILDIRTIYHYFDPYLGPTIKYEYLNLPILSPSF